MRSKIKGVFSKLPMTSVAALAVFALVVALGVGMAIADDTGGAGAAHGPGTNGGASGAATWTYTVYADKYDSKTKTAAQNLGTASINWFYDRLRDMGMYRLAPGSMGVENDYDDFLWYGEQALSRARSDAGITKGASDDNARIIAVAVTVSGDLLSTPGYVQGIDSFFHNSYANMRAPSAFNDFTSTPRKFGARNMSPNMASALDPVYVEPNNAYTKSDWRARWTFSGGYTTRSNPYPFGSAVWVPGVTADMPWPGWTVWDYGWDGLDDRMRMGRRKLDKAVSAYSYENAWGSGALSGRGVWCEFIAVAGDAPNGYMKLSKTTTGTPAFVSGNGMYSLEGAVYRVYESVSDAQTNTNPVSVTVGDVSDVDIVTGADGVSPVVEIPVGTYYVKEISSPAGHYIDPTVYGPFDIESDNDEDNPYQVGVVDPPGVKVSDIVVRKSDKNNYESPGINGAVYKVCYYDVTGKTVSQLASMTPKATWFIETKDTRVGTQTVSGLATLDEAHLATGASYNNSPFYRYDNKIVLPLGTVTVVEVKAPDGYALDSGKPNADGTLNPPDVFMKEITLDENIEATPENLAANPTVTKKAPAYYVSGKDILGRPLDLGVDMGALNTEASDVVQSTNTRQRGDLDVFKMDKDKYVFRYDSEDLWYNGSDWPTEDHAQGKGVMSGAIFDVYNSTGGNVTSPTGTVVANGGLVCTIITRSNGLASTKYEDTNGWVTLESLKRQGGALDVGEYTVRERKAPVGYKENPIWVGTAEVEYNKVVRVTAQ